MSKQPDAVAGFDWIGVSMKRQTTPSLVARTLLVLCVVIAAAGFTYATWSDSTVSENNVYATGNLDLQLRPMNSTVWTQGPVAATWNAMNMYPGQDLEAGCVYFRNAGTLEGRTFDIAVANVNTAPDMDQYIQITQMDYENGRGHNMLNPADPFHLVNTNSTPWIDLDDLEHQPRMSLPAPSTAGALTMDFRFHEDAGNEFQAASVTAEFTFTLHQ